jgi:hypothetical protein
MTEFHRPQDANPWDLMRPSMGGLFLTTRRITAKSPHNFFWAVDHVGNRGLKLNFDELVGENWTIAEFGSLEVSVSDDRKSIIIFLLKSDQKDIFRILCHDLVQSTQEIPPSDIQSVTACIFNRLNSWRELLKNKKKKGLSKAQRIGLFGELLFLNNYMVKYVGPRVAVESWQGPLGHEQDFVFGGTLFEIKTQIATSDRSVSIASMDQLDIISGPIWMVHQGISPCRGGERDCASLNELVESILAILSSDNYSRDLFFRNLEFIGYEHDNAYEDEMYLLSFSSVFDVDETFPAITRKRVGAAVIALTYKLSISELDQWKKDDKEFCRRAFSNG